MRIPPTDEDTRSIVWAIDRGEQSIEAYASDVSGSVSVALENGELVSLLLYSRSLDQLRIAPGLIPPAQTRWRRALPVPTIAYRPNGDDWIPTSTDALPLRDFELDDLSPAECALQGGCFLDEERDLRNDLICALGCPIPDLPTEPTLPDLPRFEPCPGHWTARTDDGVVICEPPDLSPPCSSGSLRFPSGECAAISDPCIGEEPFPSGFGTEAIYVRAGASGGVGTIDAPLGSIGEAVARIAPGATATIAIGEGDYTENLILVDRNISLIGVCQTKTRVHTNDRDRTTLAFGNGSYRVRHLEIIGGNPGLEVDPDAQLTIEDVSVRDGVSGLIVFGMATASRFSIIGSSAVAIRAAGSIAIDHALIDGAVRAALALQSNDIRLSSVIVRHSIHTSDGCCAVIGLEGTLSIRDVMIEESDGPAISIKGSVTAEDFAIRRSALDAASGGILMHPEARLFAERLLIDDFGRVMTIAESSSATIADAVFRGGPAILIIGSLDLERARLEAMEDAALTSLLKESTLHARDLSIRNVVGSAAIATAGDLDLHRVMLSDVSSGAWGDGPSVITDLIVRGGTSGLALRADATVDRISFDGVQGDALTGLFESTVVLRDATIRETQGSAIRIVDSSALEADRVHVVASTLDDLRLSSSKRSRFRDLRIESGGARPTAGVLSTGSFQGDIDRFYLDGGKSYGVRIDGNSSLDLHRGTIDGRELAIEVQTAEFDVRRALDRVVIGGGRIVEATSGD